MSYQRRSSTEHEPTIGTVILSWAAMSMFGVAVVLIATYAASSGLLWMYGCWK